MHCGVEGGDPEASPPTEIDSEAVPMAKCPDRTEGPPEDCGAAQVLLSGSKAAPSPRNLPPCWPPKLRISSKRPPPLNADPPKSGMPVNSPWVTATGVRAGTAPIGMQALSGVNNRNRSSKLLLANNPVSTRQSVQTNGTEKPADAPQLHIDHATKAPQWILLGIGGRVFRFTDADFRV